MLNIDPATGELSIERSPDEDVRYLLKRLALDTTKEGTLAAFADLIGKDATTVSRWMTEGDVPAYAARHLQMRFGFAAPARRLSREVREATRPLSKEE